jgi:hypothetical protein
MSLGEAIFEALDLPHRFLQASWPRRIGAIGVVVAAAAVSWWAMHLPVAMAVEDATHWQATAGDNIRLVNPDGAALLTFEGPVGKGVTLQLPNATISDASAASLASLGEPLAKRSGEFDWATDDGGYGRTQVKLKLTPTGPRPALRVQMNDGPGLTGLVFSGEDARLTVSIEGALVPPPDGAPPSKPPDADIKVAGQEFFVTAGAVPLEAEAPPGAAVALTYAQTDPDRGIFLWGVPPGALQHFSDLTLAAVQLSRPGEPDRVYACGAAPGAFVAPFGEDVAKLSCARTLRLRGLDLSRSGGAVQVSGQGFVAESGAAHVYSLDDFKESPVIGTFVAAAFAGLVVGALHTVLGKPRGKPAEDEPRPRLREAA